MDARVGAEAITTRIGAIALPLGVILLVVSTIIHPSREEPMDNPAVFMEYAQSDSWGAVHFGQWFAALLCPVLNNHLIRQLLSFCRSCEPLLPASCTVTPATWMVPYLVVVTFRFE